MVAYLIGTAAKLWLAVWDLVGNLTND